MNILRLNSPGYSQRQIAASIQSSIDTITAARRPAGQHGLEWPLPDELSSQEIHDIFYSERKKRTHRIPDNEYIHKELARAKVTLTANVKNKISAATIASFRQYSPRRG